MSKIFNTKIYILEEMTQEDLNQLALERNKLEQENKQLKENYEAVLRQRDDITKNATETIEKYQQDKKQLQQRFNNLVEEYKDKAEYTHNLIERIDKAIEHIKDKTKIIPLEEGGGLELSDYDIRNLLEILEGGNDE